MAHDVFISYSTKDKTIADAICAKLEENKIRAWIAPRDVSVGKNFAKSIIQAIDNCKVFLLIWSADSQISEHILSEINQAFDKGIPIIPFRIQDIEPNDEMRYYFGRTHWLDAIDPPLEKHILTLWDTVYANLGWDLPDKESEKYSLEDIQPIEPEKKDFSKEIKKTLRKIIPIGAFGLITLTAITLYFSGFFKGDSPIENINIYSTPTKSIPPTGTIKHTQEPTAIILPTAIPQWKLDAIEFVEPIFTAINNYPPDLYDDFSDSNNSLIFDPVNSQELLCSNSGETQGEISDGLFKINLSAECSRARLSHPNLDVDNFLVQFDLNLSEIPFEIYLDSSYYSNQEIIFHIKPGGHWSYVFLNNENVIDSSEGFINFENNEIITFSFIKQDGKFIVLYGSTLLVFHDGVLDPQDIGGNYIYFYDPLPATSKVFSIDNIKIWDLDKIILAEYDQPLD